MYASFCGCISIFYRVRNLLKCHVAWGVRVTGWRAISLGTNVVVGTGTWLNVNNRKIDSPTLQIKDNVFIGRNNFLTVGKLIVIKEYCLTASNCSFIGSSHISSNPMLPYIASGTTGQDEISIGVNCFFGYGAMVIGNVDVGHGSIIGAGCVVRHDIPPFSLVVGNPARVIKRFCFSRMCWVNPEDFNNVLSVDELTYLAALRANVPFTIQPLSAAMSFLGDM
jgi:hypothetical protein